ncbi:MAG: glycosyltransferase [Pseudomonadota bacterium]
MDDLTTTDTPRVSVLLPVYNGGVYLEDAVRSLLAQSFTDFEIIAINDGSKDASLETLERLAREDARLRVISRENRGLIATLNEAMDRARGVYLARMDADDIALPGRFAAQVAFLDAHPEVVVLGTAVLLVDAEGLPLRPFGELTDHGAIDAAHLEGRGATIVHPSAMIRAEALRAVGGYDDRYPHAEDLDLFLRLGEQGQMANLPEVLLHYRQQPNSIGHKHRDTQRESAHAALVAAYERRGLSGDAVTVKSNPASSPADTHRRFAWWAQGAGYPKTAWKHARLALRYAPFAPDTLRLVLVLVRGLIMGR